MKQRLTDSRLANLAAHTVYQGYEQYQCRFQAITRCAQQRFEAQDWAGLQQDMSQRLDVYTDTINQLEQDIRTLLEDRLEDKLVWASMKAVYSGLIAGREDWDLAETFFNSVTRRIFTTVGVDPQIEFVDTDFEAPPVPATEPVYQTFERASSTANLVRSILASHPCQPGFAHLEQDIQLVAGRIAQHLRAIGALLVVERAEIVKAVFYRGQGAYLVGRLFSGSHLVPLVLAIHHTPGGLAIDAVLLNEDDVSILFSFTRAYFFVQVERPYDLVRFLRTIMPRKRVAELYIAIGYNKHGKTALYRDILHHLAYSTDRFEIARGQKGMVMTVFTMPAYDLVFKIIKDRFAYPKRSTRQEVMSKYRLVFKHDRAGRLVDAQEYEYLQFDRQRFSPELLEELQAVAARTVLLGDGDVIIKHAYVERRIIPLDIFVTEADKAAARAAVIDYGQAIKDLAYSNIFPGDMLLKNFGVTRHGRVVFYDYDELCLLTACRFRVIPPSAHYEDELSPDPWFSVGDSDIFPEQFPAFLGLHDDLRQVFIDHHADLFGVAFWRGVQARLTAGEMIRIMPYEEGRRLAELPTPPAGIQSIPPD